MSGRGPFADKVSRDNGDGSFEILHSDDGLAPRDYRNRMSTRIARSVSHCSDEVPLDVIRVQREVSWRECSETDSEGGPDFGRKPS